MTVLDVITREKLGFQVMLGAYIDAEMNNFNCPWQWGRFFGGPTGGSPRSNGRKMDRLIRLANQYPKIIFAVSVGNEACVEWTDHYVPERQVINYVRKVKRLFSNLLHFVKTMWPGY
jgi:hypothetical protein